LSFNIKRVAVPKTNRSYTKYQIDVFGKDGREIGHWTDYVGPHGKSCQEGRYSLRSEKFLRKILGLPFVILPEDALGALGEHFYSITLKGIAEHGEYGRKSCKGHPGPVRSPWVKAIEHAKGCTLKDEYSPADIRCAKGTAAENYLGADPMSIYNLDQSWFSVEDLKDGFLVVEHLNNGHIKNTWKVAHKHTVDSRKYLITPGNEKGTIEVHLLSYESKVLQVGSGGSKKNINAEDENFECIGIYEFRKRFDLGIDHT